MRIRISTIRIYFDNLVFIAYMLMSEVKTDLSLDLSINSDFNNNDVKEAYYFSIDNHFLFDGWNIMSNFFSDSSNYFY